MGADFYESNEQRAQLLAAGDVPVGVGEGSVITNAIVDKNARIGRVRHTSWIARVNIINCVNLSVCSLLSDVFVVLCLGLAAVCLC